MSDYDSESYTIFTSKSERDKAVHTLEGLLRGISIDDVIDKQELAELKEWCSQNQQFIDRQPFSELIPQIIESLEDDYLDEEERQSILTICHYVDSGSDYYDFVTADLQRLQGILHGIMSNNEITDIEVRHLDNWLQENDHLKGYYPYDEITSLILSVLEDNVITKDERDQLKVIFSEFIDQSKKTNIDFDKIQELKETYHLDGITTSNPDISFENNYFCITGKFANHKRSDVAKVIEDLNGNISKNVSHKTNYLIVGSDGNKCWAYSCYGRKVEQATNFRKEGMNIQIIKEEDFWDSVEDHS